MLADHAWAEYLGHPLGGRRQEWPGCLPGPASTERLGKPLRVRESRPAALGLSATRASARGLGQGQPPGLEAQDAAAAGAISSSWVTRDEGGALAGAEVEHQLDDLVPGGGVEVASRFRRRGRGADRAKRPGQGDALLLPPAGGDAWGSGASDGRVRPAPASAGWSRPGGSQFNHDRFPGGGEGRQELKGLEDEAEQPAAQDSPLILPEPGGGFAPS